MKEKKKKALSVRPVPPEFPAVGVATVASREVVVSGSCVAVLPMVIGGTSDSNCPLTLPAG